MPTRRQGRQEELETRLAALEQQLAALQRHLDKRLDKRVDGLQRDLSRLAKVAADIDGNVQSLLRRDAVERFGAPFPERLTARRWRGLSHQEEDGLTLAVLEELGTPLRRAVEIGCGTNGGNSGLLAAELGWTCLMLDPAPWCTEATAALNPRTITAVAQAVTSGNVNGILSEHGFTGELDLLSIDIDSRDWWVWNALTVPDRDDLDREALAPDLRGLWFGASLQAFGRLAQEKGYRLVAVTPPGVNAYWLRDDLAPHVPALDLARAWRPLDKLEKAFAAVDPERRVDRLVAAFADAGYPIVDLDASST